MYNVFLFKLVNGYTDCPELLNFLNFKVPQRRTKSTNIFLYRFSKNKLFFIFTYQQNYVIRETLIYLILLPWNLLIITMLIDFYVLMDLYYYYY